MAYESLLRDIDDFLNEAKPQYEAVKKVLTEGTYPVAMDWARVAANRIEILDTLIRDECTNMPIGVGYEEMVEKVARGKKSVLEAFIQVANEARCTAIEAEKIRQAAEEAVQGMKHLV